VSGGADSMALAYLLQRVAKDESKKLLSHIRPLAFVINHNSREGSGEEAGLVQKELSKFGTNHRVLSLSLS
jgi:tRNA(Ile)-lysidine synthase TilS/MesJ